MGLQLRSARQLGRQASLLSRLSPSVDMASAPSFADRSLAGIGDGLSSWRLRGRQISRFRCSLCTPNSGEFDLTSRWLSVLQPPNAGFRFGPSRAVEGTRPVRAKGMATKTTHTALSLVGRTQTDVDDRHSSEFLELAKELQVLLELGNLSLIRDRLSESIGWLRSCADSTEHDEVAAAEELQNELRAVQGRLHEAENLAATDCLTGLANRREAEKLMVRRIQVGQPFCILLFDLDNFKQVNDRHGHQAGDNLLKAFSNRLASQFRPDDVVCRWGGDEFLVVMMCAMPDALGKASLVAGRLSGQYAMESASGAVNICVSASVGVAQHAAGESGRELFARADALLYQDKAESRLSGVPAHAHTASWDGIGTQDGAGHLADTACRAQDAAGADGFTILIADDEAGIRMLAGEVLRSHGYNVLQAADGVEALDLAAQHPGPIHLLLTDLSMPRLDGRELHRRLNSVRPGTATLFMSGDLDTGLHPDAAFLPKPFATSVLVRKVSDALKAKVG